MYDTRKLNQVARNTKDLIIKVYVSLKKLVHELAIVILSSLFSIFIYLLLGKVILETKSSTFWNKLLNVKYAGNFDVWVDGL